MLLCAYIYPLFGPAHFDCDRVAEVLRPMIQLVKLFELVAPAPAQAHPGQLYQQHFLGAVEVQSPTSTM
jgi:hypothetical protein